MRNQPHPAHDIDHSMLKVGNLIDQFGLPGLKGRLVQSEHMIQHSHRRLQPVTFTATQFFSFHPQMFLFGHIHALHDFDKPGGFLSHGCGNLISILNRRDTMILNGLPLTGGLPDVLLQLGQCLQLLCEVLKLIDLTTFQIGPVVQKQWKRAEKHAHHQAADHDAKLETGWQSPHIPDDPSRHGEQQQITDQEGGFGDAIRLIG